MYLCRVKNIVDIEFDAEIGHLTTFGIGARAAALVRWQSVEDLKAIVADESLPRPLKAIGGGSNLLFTRPFKGTLLLRTAEPRVERDGLTYVVDCQIELDALCERVAADGLRGTENLSGIPGTLGGALVQNAGAYGAEIGDVVESVELFDLFTAETVTLSRADMDYAYRSSRLKTEGGRYVALSARLNMEPADSPARIDYGNIRSVLGDSEPTPKAVRRAVLEVRRKKLPATDRVGSAGSFFRNPEVDESVLTPEMPRYRLDNGLYKVPAAWLIDRAGLKGVREGGAATWAEQPLVIVNAEGRATAADVLRLEQRIVSTVRSLFSITLIPEVEHL